METKFQTSFIPKTTIEPESTGGTKRPLGLLTFIATIIFFISVVVAAGAFGWEKYLESKDAKMQSDLQKNIKAFEPQTIEEYVRLGNRIYAAERLLSKHIAVSYIFDFLAQNTLQSVAFSDFKYTVAADGTASLSMNGLAKSYNAVAYQSEVFGRERALEGPIFANLDLDGSGNVLFNFATKVNPGFIAYSRKAPTATGAVSNDVVPLDLSGASQNPTGSQPSNQSATGTAQTATTTTQ